MDADSKQTLDISEDDIYEAMKEIDGYLDITPGDFKALYGVAHRHAIKVDGDILYCSCQEEKWIRKKPIKTRG